ncbi:MAG: triphosphatase [Alteromonadaceae bacterium]|jgi:triphosphatase
MTTEVELKYLVLCSDAAAKITAVLTDKKITYEQSTTHLSNCYFDTLELALRHQDMGLRVRESDSFIEQTIKTAGKTLGGLHQRPEYNVTIDKRFPELALFPKNIWSASQSVSLLQDQLIALFTTDFLRTKWLVTLNEYTQVEVVFDQGKITSKGQSVDLLEIELELVIGDISALFLLAELFFDVLDVRPGIKSKAARGYALYHEKVTGEHNFATCIPLKIAANTEQAFSSGVDFSLQELQIVIDAYLQCPSLENLVQINEALIVLRHGFWLFRDTMSAEVFQIKEELSHFIQLLSWANNALFLEELTNKTGNYRKKLELSEQLIEQLKLEKRRLPSINDVTKLLHSKRFNCLQLSLLKFLCAESNTQNSILNDTNAMLNFAHHALSTSLSELQAIIPEALSLSSKQYLEQSKLLNRCLLTSNWLGNLYDENERMVYLAPWLDLKRGLTELQTLWIIQQQLQQLDEQPIKLVNWQDSKVDSLLHALDNSRRKALSVAPYWQH